MTKQETNWKEVQQLLDRFYEGATTQTEEKYLMEVLTLDCIPEHFRTDAEVFRALKEESDQIDAEPALPSGFDQRLMERIRQEEGAAETPVVALRSPKSNMSKWWSVAAACLLVAIFSVVNLFDRNDPDAMFAASDITQQEAEEYADYALSLISMNMRAGMQELDELSRVQEQIRTTLNQLPD